MGLMLKLRSMLTPKPPSLRKGKFIKCANCGKYRWTRYKELCGTCYMKKFRERK